MNEFSAPEVSKSDAGRGGPPAAGPPSIVSTALLFYGALGAIALAIVWLRGTPLGFAGDDARPVDWPGDVALGAVCAGVTVAASEILTRTTHWGSAMSEALARQIGPLSHRACWGLALVSGIAEEALFRGALQPWFGFVAASLLFGLAHFVPRRELLPWTGFAVLAGFGLGALFHATGNLVAPVVAHIGVNGINLRRLTRDLPSPD
jgi:membrane protease YdiL (CAAX protease family)